MMFQIAVGVIAKRIRKKRGIRHRKPIEALNWSTCNASIAVRTTRRQRRTLTKSVIVAEYKLEDHMELKDDKNDNAQSAQDQPGGTTFTVNLGEVELSEDEKSSIMSDITKAAMSRASSLRAAAAARRVIFGRFGSFGSFGRFVVVQ